MARAYMTKEDDNGETHLLCNGAAAGTSAPTSFSTAPTNGCISEISSNAIQSREHDYTDAMKSYAVVYEKYQSYLMPQEQILPHDNDLVVNSEVAANPIADSRLGCLNVELLDGTEPEKIISDEDIENCGYAAWVRH